MGSLAALIAALERAEEGSRELSDEVLLALGWGTRLEFTREVWVAPSGDSSKHRSDPTRNLQGAVDLVPEGMDWWEVGKVRDKPFMGRGTHRAAIGKWGEPEHYQHAMSPALALCVAILRAVEAKDG